MDIIRIFRMRTPDYPAFSKPSRLPPETQRIDAMTTATAATQATALPAPAWQPLLAATGRVLIAAIFVMSGLAKIADPAGTIVAVSNGVCGGLIADHPAGAGGFGYDPLFIVPEYHRTFGELSPAVKAVISHRARAMRAIIPAIERSLHPGRPPAGE